ncbi:MAG: tryptophan-rich sensory protein [Clostridiaceae bacterium]|jgi:hypothetical protein
MKKSIQALAAATFILMVVVNALANILPINGIGTGAVSDSYPNLFAPAGITFAIWGVIYLLLAAYTVFQLGLFKKNRSMSDALMNKVGVVFSISSIANTVWIFSWHYRIIVLSMVLMLIILVCLAIIVSAIRKESLSLIEKIYVKLPFSIYFGWITVATIANLTTLLVSVGWNGFGLSQSVWAVAIIAIGAIIGIVTILRNKDYPYGLVILWAYAGIVIKHVSTSGFNGMYPAVIITTITAMVLVVVAEVIAITKKAY